MDTSCHRHFWKETTARDDFSKMPSDRHRHRVTDESVITVGRSRRTGCARNRPRGAVAELIRDVEIKLFAFKSGPDTEEMLVHIRHQWRVMRVGNGIFIENIAGTHMPAVVKIACDAPFKKPT